MLGRGEQVGLSECFLASAQSLEEPTVVGKPGTNMCPVFGKLPASWWEIKGQFSRGVQLVAFMDPGLVVVVIG